VRASRWLPFERDERVRSVASYEIAAGALGVPWYLAMVVLPGRDSPFVAAQGTMDPKDHLFASAVFIGTSLAVATAFRSPILRSSSKWVPALGTVLMLVGAGLFMLASSALAFALDGNGEDWSVFLSPDVMLVPLVGVVIAMRMFLITIPMGIASVCALRWIDRLSRR
jgi:hypothetical protein